LPAFAGQKYLNLETFKKNGDGVRRRCGRADPSASLDSGAAKIYAYTIGVSGKVKRVRNNPHVKIAPCNMSGKVLGEWVEARAEIISGEEAVRGMQLLNKKYFPWKQLLAAFASLSRRERIVFAIRPA